MPFSLEEVISQYHQARWTITANVYIIIYLSKVLPGVKCQVTHASPNIIFTFSKIE